MFYILIHNPTEKYPVIPFNGSVVKKTNQDIHIMEYDLVIKGTVYSKI